MRQNVTRSDCICFLLFDFGSARCTCTFLSRQCILPVRPALELLILNDLNPCHRYRVSKHLFYDLAILMRGHAGLDTQYSGHTVIVRIQDERHVFHATVGESLLPVDTQVLEPLACGMKIIDRNRCPLLAHPLCELHFAIPICPNP